MKIDEIAWLKTAGTRSTVHVRLVAWHRQLQLVRFSPSSILILKPQLSKHQSWVARFLVEVLFDERRKIVKVGSHQLAIEENGECRSVDRNYLLCINFFERSNKISV
ncbi:hypothetical protein WN944_002493 [Citrus x changshan-huyou]|uniref:Uncharacterized protein n=1 Tax=Citrus x changshan-huyou TaxID=2935761 RepID=A0AAP0MJ47_9ROSI